MRVLLTGATGFIGKAIQKKLSGYRVRIVSRRKLADCPSNHFQKEMSKNENFADCLKDIDVVIHTAAKVHKMNSSKHFIDEYSEVNHKATINLAKQAVDAGIKRFIFISSIKVNGEKTLLNESFKYDDKTNPQDAYAISKAKAEQDLLQLAKVSKLEVVIIRPPLVYGPGAKGNFQTLLKISKKNIPMPLKSINNKRSLVAIDNLVDLIEICMTHPNARNQVFLVSDDIAISTSDLINSIKNAYGLKPNLFYINPILIKTFARIFQKQSMMNRLFDNLNVDIKHTKYTLNWSPPFSINKVIKECIAFEYKK